MRGHPQSPILEQALSVSVAVTEGLQVLTVITPIHKPPPDCFLLFGRYWDRAYRYDGVENLVSLYLST
jgi:hypothetical protein